MSVVFEAAEPVQLSPVQLAVGQVPKAEFFGEHGPLTGSASRPPPAAVVALLEALQVTKDCRVLQIGGGSGYVSAALAPLAGQLTVVEQVEPLVALIEARLAAVGVRGVEVRHGEGRHGWPAGAPYDRILIVATRLMAGGELMEQLAPGGLVVSTGDGREGAREIIRHRKDHRGVIERAVVGTVRFKRDLGDALESMGLVDPHIIELARRRARISKQPLQEVLGEMTRIDEGDMYRAMARHAGMRSLSIPALLEQLDPNLAEQVPRAFLDHHRMVPIGKVEGELLVATTKVNAQPDELQAVFPGERLALCLVSPTGFRRIWSAIDLRQGARDEGQAPASSGHAGAVDILDADPGALESYASSAFEALLLDAIGERASDIHLERYGDRTRVRLRVDGELRDQVQYRLDRAELDAVINVIKVRSELDIAERRLPQGGRIRLRAGELRYDLRVQTQPSLHGEHVVIRLLPQKSRMLSIEDLGFDPVIAAHYRRLLDSPSGMVLVVGPTGSGKSTTLYAGLQELADDARRKVITVEDPVEYSIDGIQQTQVKPQIGFGFANAMRAFVRQDPDVILVGEIRDAETALEAIRASQTGHLVLSTLHCNDAVDAVQRLYDLGMHPSSIASELLAVFSQRLARRICPRCRRPATADPQLLAEIFPAGVPEDFVCFEGAGCPSCSGHGTRGRVASFEYMRVTADIRRAIFRQPALDDLRELARRAGLHTLRRSLLAQVQQGLVPLPEIRRLLHADAMAGEALGASEVLGTSEDS